MCIYDVLECINVTLRFVSFLFFFFFKISFLFFVFLVISQFICFLNSSKYFHIIYSLWINIAVLYE